MGDSPLVVGVADKVTGVACETALNDVKLELKWR